MSSPTKVYSMEFQIQKLIKSFPKFSNQIERMDIVVEDAKRKDKNIDDLKKLGKLLIERAKAAMIIPLCRDQSGEEPKIHTGVDREQLKTIPNFLSVSMSMAWVQAQGAISRKILHLVLN
ncbi:uncharacterized protein LOC136039449 [Artemia franciscana]|uniref:uncharacterized protein LOC136039449 n=1 Tax=Artemia franciscana TaxID=6661 RepID=UPI0032DBEDCA